MKTSNSGSKNTGGSVPIKERALVLQGGGSLGAYEAGAYKALYKWLTDKDEKDEQGARPIFDIVAGTSIGAMNAAVLTSYVVENETYEGSSDRLIEFWHYLSKESTIDTNPFFKKWWDQWNHVSKTVATGEAARRYYSAKEFALLGVPNVFAPLTPTFDTRFFDTSNVWYRFSNTPLKRSLEKFCKFPIATSQENHQPRLILVAVDVAEGLPVTFDSYPKEDGSRKTEYGKVIQGEDDDLGFEHVIEYNDGITADHVIASGSFPVNFDYARLDVASYRSDGTKNENGFNTSIGKKNSDVIHKNTISKSNSKSVLNDEHFSLEKRYFWDGGLLSNTPLTQLVLLHRRYWYFQRGLKDKVPTLAVCAINVHPNKQKEIPMDRDGVLSRNADISFSDRSHRDEEVLLLISDYVHLIRELVKTAKDGGISDETIDNLMNQRTISHGQDIKARRYREIVEGRFDISEIYRIEKQTNQDTIADKTFDFSSGTIQELLNEGYRDAMRYIEGYVRPKISKV
ncbi:MAG TPA: patatin-like phospholipase family protein [Nitrososphaeraceae archaeon]|nr:patatin-like phospholipase family protein [Nitrososphaeraceae archaeon]